MIGRMIALTSSRAVAWLLFSLTIGTLLGLSTDVSLAQSVTPAQVRQLMQLPASERERLMRSLGITNADLAALLPPGALPQDSEPGSAALDEQNPLLLPSEAGSAPALTQPQKLVAESTIVIEFRRREVAAEVEDGGVEELPPFLRELTGSRTYELDRYGVLHLQNVFHIELAGLSAAQAATRIQSEPGLDGFLVEVELLPLAPTGADALKLYGSDFLSRADALLFDPSVLAVPGDYVVGPADVLVVNLFGADSQNLELTVDREGRVSMPQIGPIAVAGLSLDAVRSEIRTRVSEQMIGVDTTVTLNRLRSIQVTVTGDAMETGFLTVDSLTTITNALLLSGGVREYGSLRGVQLKRDGRVIATLDLYDLLLRGDARDDQRLRNGDVVFVPPIGPVASVEGAVNRPARYELRGETTVDQLIALAGGPSAEAQLGNARLERIVPSGVRTVIDIDLNSSAGRQQVLRNGDVLRVTPAQRLARGVVTLEGHVRAPRDYQWYEGLRLTDLITSPDALREFADSSYVVIRREDRTGRVSVVSADLRRALAAPGGMDDLMLRPRDRITVFQLNRDRSGVIEPILEALTDQGRFDEPLPVAVASGAVMVGGRYPIEPGMRVSDLLRAAGGLTEYAFLTEAQLTRRVVVPGQDARTEFITIDLEEILAGDTSADLPLQSRDSLLVNTVPDINQSDQVTLEGEVRFPGTYPVARGETLADLVARAGGLTKYAFPSGATFTRVDLRQREQQRLEQLARRLENDLAVAALQGAQSIDGGGNPGEALRIGGELLVQIRETPAVGRLVIDLDRLVSEGAGSPADVMLRDGDRLVVPEVSQEVTVLGQVQFPGSHLFDPGKSLEEYLGRAGKPTKNADVKRIYVVRANGEVVTSSDSRWFRGSQIQIALGDTIVVPLNADRMRPLSLWTSISRITYQLALTAAAANAVGVF